MNEWVDGYWTALNQVASALNQVAAALTHGANTVPQVAEHNTSAVDWLSALATLVAAIATSAAAFYAAKAATVASKSLEKTEIHQANAEKHQANAEKYQANAEKYQANAEKLQLVLYNDKLETRKTEIVKEANFITTESRQKALLSQIVHSNMTRERRNISNDLNEWDKILSEIAKSIEEYLDTADHANIASSLNDGTTIASVEAIRTNLLNIRIKAGAVDADRIGQDYRAEIIRSNQAVITR